VIVGGTGGSTVLPPVAEASQSAPGQVAFGSVASVIVRDGELELLPLIAVVTWVTIDVVGGDEMELIGAERRDGRSTSDKVKGGQTAVKVKRL